MLPKQDRISTRTAKELEQKYDLQELLTGDVKNFVNQSKQIELLNDEINRMRIDIVTLQNRITASSEITNTVSGESIAVTDATDQPLRGLRVFGKSEQKGTPTPDNPIPIVSTGDDGDIEVGVHGKNLFDLEKVVNGYFSLSEATIVASATARTVYIKCEPNTAYTVSKKATTRFRVGCCVGLPSVGSSVTGVIAHDAASEITITTSDNCDYLVAFVSSTSNDGISAEEMLATVQIERGSTATSYEPFTKQSLTIPTPNGLKGIKVTDSSLATYTDSNGQMWVADEVDFERGLYVQRIGVIESYSNEVVSSEYLSTTGGWDSGSYVIYILATPIETPLSVGTIAAYKVLRTNYPNMTILNDSGAGMEVKYGADTKLYIDNKFAKLTNAN